MENQSPIESLPVIDHEVISRLESFDPNGMRGLVRRLVALYLESAPASLADLKRFQTLEANDQLRMQAHKFKTTNANLGLARMRVLLQNLEDHFDESDLKKKLLEKIDAEGALALEAIRSLQKPAPGGAASR